MGLKPKAAGIASVALVAGIAFWFVERPATTDVDFRNLPFARFDFGTPEAPGAFPDCTPDMLDIRRDDSDGRLEMTLRPKPAVQCGVPAYPQTWWIDSSGARFDPMEPDSEWAGKRMLLMGDNGAQEGGGINRACTMEAPLTYYMELGGQSLEVGTLKKKPRCGPSGQNRIHPSVLYYRSGGFETPAGSLEGAIEQLTIEGLVATFVFVMTNDTDDGIVIGRCPWIDVESQPPDEEREGPGFRTYLDCPSAPDVIEPGDAVRFDIEAELPEVIPGGVIEVELRNESRVLYRVRSGAAA